MIQELTDETFDSSITENDIHVVYAYTDWCEKCKDVSKILEMMQYEFDNPFYKFNAEKCEYISKKLRLRVVPLIMIFVNGKMRQFVIGDKIDERTVRLTIRTINKTYNYKKAG